MNSPAAHINRSFGLDACRTLACLLVVFGHMLGHSLPNPILAKFDFLAIFGVDLFFCLSGFLIGRILLKEAAKWDELKVKGLTHFWYRRWMRTLPLYIFFFFVSLRYDWTGATTLVDQFRYLVFAQNFAWAMPDFYRLTWSLAIEEWFYYTFPLVMLLLIGLGADVKRAAIITIASFMVVPFIARIGLPIQPVRYDDARYVVIFRLDAIGLGVLVSYLYTWHRSIFDRMIKFWYVPAAMVTAIIVLTRLGYPWDANNKIVESIFFTSSAAVFFAALIPAFQNLAPSRYSLLNRFVKFTSKISYSIYLGHVFAFIFVITTLNRFNLYDSVYNNPWLVYPIFTVSIYVLAYVTYSLVEKPFLDLRDAKGDFFKVPKFFQTLCVGKNKTMTGSAQHAFSSPSPQTNADKLYLPGSIPNSQRGQVLAVSYASEPVADFFEVYQSLRRQTFQNWKWLICYDATHEQQLNEFFLKEVSSDERVFIFNISDRSLITDALAGPEYIVLVDKNTLLAPTFLEKGLWLLASNPEFAFCNSFGELDGVEGGLITEDLANGIQYLASKNPKVRGTIFLKPVLVETFDDVAELADGRDPFNMLARLADEGYWGFTIPEYLQRCVAPAPMAGAEGSRSSPPKSMPSPLRRPTSAYETLPEDFPCNNPLKRNSTGRSVMFLLPWMVEGGADRVNIDLIESLVADGVDVTVCATLEADHRWLIKFAELTPGIFILPNFLSLSDFPRFILYMIASRSIDTVLITGSTLGYQLLPYLRAAAPDTAFIDLCHTEEMHWLNGGHPRFALGYQDALDINTVSTRHLCEWMIQRGANPDNIRVVYTGIKSNPVSLSKSERDAVLNSYNLDKNALTIIFAGRMSNQKRPLKIAEILGALKQTGVPFNALIIGEGELRPAFEDAIKRLGLGNNVRVLGAKPHSEWLSLLAVSDVLLMPSEYEGISIALLEAMSAGVVPVVADVGGQDELVDQKIGYLIAHSDDEVTHYVAALHALARDSAMREEKAQACRQLINDNFTAAATSRQWREILDEAQARRSISTQPFMALRLAKELATSALETRRVTSYLDQLYSTHCLTNDAQTEVLPPQHITHLIIAKLRQYPLVKYMLTKPLTKKLIRKTRALFS